MRTAFSLAAVVLLAACDSGEVPRPGQELRGPSRQVAEDEVLLHAEGLVAGPEAFYFAAGRSEVEAALGKVMGEPLERSENPECGAGPMEFTEYAGGVIVNFQKDNLVGWNSSDKFGPSRVEADVQIGMARAEASEANGFAEVETSTLGDEFSLGRLGGFFDGDEVVMLYAGAQCFKR